MPILILSVSLLFAGQMPNDAELRGVWQVKSGSINGEPITLLEREKRLFSFGDDNKLHIRHTGAPDRFARYASGPGLLTKDLDITPIGDDKESTMDALGIFKHEDDGALLIAVSSERVNGKDSRPADFDAKKKIVLLRLEKQKPGHADEAKTPPAAKAGAKAPTLAGRWELIVDKNSKETLEIEFVSYFFSGTKELVIRGKSTSSFFGLAADRQATVRATMATDGDTPKNTFAVFEKFDDKKEATGRLIRYCFRGETLELLGAVAPADFGTYNLTGEWRRVVNTKK